MRSVRTAPEIARRSCRIANVGDPVASHAEPLDTQTKGETGDLFGIVADGLQDVGIDHSGAAELDPVIVPAEVGFDAGFGEREERWPKADVHIEPR